jgi:hypothetical protein
MPVHSKICKVFTNCTECLWLKQYDAGGRGSMRLLSPISVLVICWRHFYGPIYFSFVFRLCHDTYMKHISFTAQTDPPTFLTDPCFTIPNGCLWFPPWQTAIFILFCYGCVLFNWHHEYYWGIRVQCTREGAQVRVDVFHCTPQGVWSLLKRTLFLLRNRVSNGDATR